MTQLQHIVSLETGDWSNDGHNISRVFTFKSNYPQSQIEAAYNTAVARGVPDISSQCEDYEDSSLTEEFAVKWLELSKTTMPELEQMNQFIFSRTFFSDEFRDRPHEDDPAENAIAMAVSEKYGLDFQARSKSLDDEDFVQIYLFIASTILTDLKYEEANPQTPIRPGGYGLYYG